MSRVEAISLELSSLASTLSARSGRRLLRAEAEHAHSTSTGLGRPPAEPVANSNSVAFQLQLPDGRLEVDLPLGPWGWCLSIVHSSASVESLKERRVQGLGRGASGTPPPAGR